MSITYPQFVNSTFPDTLDAWNNFQDLNASEFAIVDQYYNLMRNGDTVGANNLINNNNLQDKILNSNTLNKLGDAIKSVQKFFKDGTETFLQNKQTEWQNEIDKMQYKQDYNPTTRYYKNNFVTYTNATNVYGVYLCINDNNKIGIIGISPETTTSWIQLSLRGEKGENGINLNMKGAFKPSVTYNTGDAVQFGGVLFGSLIDGNTGHQPDVTRDEDGYWMKVLYSTVITTSTSGYRDVTVTTNVVNFMNIGTINAFNPAVDYLELHLNGLKQILGTDYVIQNDNISVKKVSGNWVGTPANPLRFDFVVIRNQISNLVFADGASLANNSVPITKFTPAVQDAINSIPVIQADLSTQIQAVNTDLTTVKNDLYNNKDLTSKITSGVITNLTSGKNGMITGMSVKGKTMYKKADGTLTDVWESGVSLESVGEPVISNINLFISTNILKGYYYGVDGSNSAGTSSSLNTQFINIDSSKTYYSSKEVMVVTYDTNKNFIERLYNGSAKSIHTFNSNVKYIRISQFEKGLSYLDDLKFSEIAYKIEILSQGKNWFNKNMSYITGKYIDKDTGNLINDSNFKVSDYIEVVPNSSFIRSITYPRDYCYFDKNKNYISGSNSQQFTTPNNCYYIKLSIGINDDLNTLQIEQGTTVTTYEQYKDDKTEILTTQPLRKISETIYDSIDTNGIITRNCGQVVLNGSEGWVYDSGFSTTDILYFVYPNGLLFKPSNNIIISCISDKFQGYGWGTRPSNGEFIAQNSNSLIIIGINKSKLTTQDGAGFKTWLAQNPVTLVYQLADLAKTTESLNKTLVLSSYDSGSLIVNSGLVNPEISFSYPTSTYGSIFSIADGMGDINENMQTIIYNQQQTISTLQNNSNSMQTTINTLQNSLNVSNNTISAMQQQITTINNTISTMQNTIWITQ